MLAHDVPASATAYELYLRANQRARESSAWTLARDLYLECVKGDPHYAPAWARLGRIYWLLAKYSNVDAQENFRLAQELARRLGVADPVFGMEAKAAIGELWRGATGPVARLDLARVFRARRPMTTRRVAAVIDHLLAGSRAGVLRRLADPHCFDLRGPRSSRARKGHSLFPGFAGHRTRRHPFL